MYGKNLSFGPSFPGQVGWSAIRKADSHLFYRYFMAVWA